MQTVGDGVYISATNPHLFMGKLNVKWGSLFLVAGFALVFLIKLDIVRPADWFTDPTPDPALLTSSLEVATSADTPAFAMLTSLNRTSDGFYTSRAGKAVSGSGLLGNLIQGLNASLQLPRTINILVKPCGQTNAYYDPAASQIVFCDEFFYQAEQLFSPRASDQASFEGAVMGATTFTLFHEIGHALIDQLDLRFLGREEDAADQIATYLLTVSGASEQALQGAMFFAYFSEYQPGHSFPYWDEHGLNEQRFYNITCWLYGLDPGRYTFLVANQILPGDRARWCMEEAAQMGVTIAEDLGPHLKQ